ncbi:uncharacterized protein JCM6883_006646 [Sporobolomyces salmoneus]|uniref:uncharacterized protein n=1 Tax=Sporobolomyces salmoneus TaxID=183962 RepID=UPI00316F5575
MSGSTSANSTSQQVRGALEASYKSTRLELSRILAFKAHLQQHGAAQYGRVPQSMVTALKGEMDKFDTICLELEKRVLRAIATLERDAKKASNPLPDSTKPEQSDPILPSSEPASSALPTTITSESQTTGPETIVLDDDPLPTAPRGVDQSMQIDLTLSPTPPPPHLPAAASEPVPFALPTSSSSASLASASTSNAPLASQPLVNSNATTAPPPSDDLNALLSSLNMPPFDPNAFLNSSTAAGGGGASSTGLSADALAALLGTDTTAMPAPSTNAPATGGAGGGQDINLTGFDFSSISGLNTSIPSTSNPPAPPIAPTPGFTGVGGTGMNFDFSSLGGLGGGNGAGLSDFVDYSALGSGSGTGNEFDLAGLGLPPASGGGGMGGGEMTEEQLQELLKNLGG